MGARDSR
jgi:hypothetical protein